MSRFFDFAGFVAAPLPAADVYETDGEFVVELEVPGSESIGERWIVRSGVRAHATVGP